MDFALSDDRRILRDTLTRFLAEQYPVAHRIACAYQPPFHDPGKWQALTDLGILHALVPETGGGLGGAGFDVAVVFEALGGVLCPEPVLGALLCARVLGAAGRDLTGLLTGRTRWAFAVSEPDFGTDTAARPANAAWELTGRKSVVYGGASAHRYLVVACREDTGAPAIFEVAADDADTTAYGMIDGGGAAEVFLDRSPGVLVASGPGAAADALDWGALALCAEAVGAMDSAIAMLLDFLKTRHQFGRPIGSFQALQHRMVDLTVAVEQARSITILAASRMEDETRAHTVSMAKCLIGRTAGQVAEELIQMHGGIAMTWDHPASHFAKRLVMIDHQLGNGDIHLNRVIADLQSGG